MHESVINFVQKQVKQFGLGGRKTIEIGSLNVNGSVRSLFDGEYLGIDMRDGDGVDEVLTAVEAGEKYAGQYDVCVSTEMLEHCEDWRGAVNAMKSVLKDDGVLLLTTRSAGFGRHDYPGDYWRFSVQNMYDAFSDMWVTVTVDPQFPGVFVMARKIAGQSPVDLWKIEVDFV